MECTGAGTFPKVVRHRPESRPEGQSWDFGEGHPAPSLPPRGSGSAVNSPRAPAKNEMVHVTISKKIWHLVIAF